MIDEFTITSEIIHVTACRDISIDALKMNKNKNSIEKFLNCGSVVDEFVFKR